MIGLCGLGLTLFAMFVATVPPSDTADVGLFEMKVLGGAGFIVALGLLVYWRGRR